MAYGQKLQSGWILHAESSLFDLGNGFWGMALYLYDLYSLCTLFIISPLITHLFFSFIFAPKLNEYAIRRK